jgi:hypothetical protein
MQVTEKKFIRKKILGKYKEFQHLYKTERMFSNYYDTCINCIRIE